MKIIAGWSLYAKLNTAATAELKEDDQIKEKYIVVGKQLKFIIKFSTDASFCDTKDPEMKEGSILR